MSHTLDIRVYYHDTDAGGVVYHGSYLDFGERARTEFLRAIGQDHGTLRDQYGMIFVVRKLDIDYLLPGLLDDLIVLETSVISMKNTSFVMQQVFRRGEDVIAKMDVVLVCIDAKALRPVKIPERLKSGLQQHLVD